MRHVLMSPPSLPQVLVQFQQTLNQAKCVCAKAACSCPTNSTVITFQLS